MSTYPFPNPSFIREESSTESSFSFTVPYITNSGRNSTADPVQAGSRARKWSRGCGSTTEKRPRNMLLASDAVKTSNNSNNVDGISDNQSIHGEKNVAGLVDDMLSAFTVSALTSLHIPDLLKGGPKSALEITALIGNADTSHIERYCEACVALEYLQIDCSSGTKKYDMTQLGEKLQQDAPGSMGAYILGETDLVHMASWDKCVDSVKTGTSQTKEVFGQYVWDYYETHSDEGKVFMAEMGAITRDFNNAITLTYDFVGTKVVDVGGSHGHFLVSVLRDLPKATGILFELEGCVNQAQAFLKSTTVNDRITCQVGDFFQSVPSGDLYLLKWICHDWDDANVIKILKNIRSAMLSRRQSLHP